MSRRPKADVRTIAATDEQIDALVYELHGPTQDEVWTVGEANGARK